MLTLSPVLLTRDTSGNTDYFQVGLNFPSFLPQTWLARSFMGRGRFQILKCPLSELSPDLIQGHASHVSTPTGRVFRAQMASVPGPRASHMALTQQPALGLANNPPSGRVPGLSCCSPGSQAAPQPTQPATGPSGLLPTAEATSNATE